MDGLVVVGGDVVGGSSSSSNRIHARQPATLVRIRAGRAANKRRSWHAARVADDIQRSLADQSPVTKARSEVWHPSDDWSTSYHTESGWATAPNRELRLPGSAVSGEQLQVGPPSSSPSLWTPPAQTSGVSFSIASWVDRPPLIVGMDNANASIVSRSKQPSQSERLRHFLWPEHAATAYSNDDSVDGSSDDDEGVFSRVAPARLVPVTLRSTEFISPTGEEEEQESDPQHRRISSSLSNNFIDVVVKELRGASTHSTAIESVPFFPLPYSIFSTVSYRLLSLVCVVFPIVINGFPSPPLLFLFLPVSFCCCRFWKFDAAISFQLPLSCTCEPCQVSR